MSRLRLLDNPVDLFEGEVAAAFFFADERPLRGPQALLDWRLNGPLTDLLLQGRISGVVGEHVLVRSNGKVAADWVLFIGGGTRRRQGEEDLRRLLRHLLDTCRRAGFSRIALGLAIPPGMTPFSLEGLVREALEGMPGENLDCLLSISDDAAPLV